MAPARPISSRTTTSTQLSTASYDSYDHPTTASTALTTPDLASPGKDIFRLEPILDVIPESEDQGIEKEESGTTVNAMYAEETRSSRRRSIDLSRGSSVRDRAFQFESHASGSSRPLAPPTGRTRSTSPLRINRKTSSQVTTPTNIRRVPVPATAPPARIQRDHNHPIMVSPPGGQRTPLEIKRGQGSTRRMVQQWESLPSTPAVPPPLRPSPAQPRILTREYLDQKPLPIPQANQIPSSSRYSSPGLGHPSQSPARTSYVPSPLQHLQTPTQNRKRSSTLTPSASSYSLSPSPSGDKRRKNGGRSPLKDMLNVFGGGIRDLGRRAKGKGKDKGRKRGESFGSGDLGGWDGGLERMGSNGLPGGIVFSDRMGDREMNGRSMTDPTIVRQSAVLYLIPTPCSSVSQWGSWLTSWASLSTEVMRVTYCPIFQQPQSGNTTPRRVLSGANPNHSTPGVPFASIPPPGNYAVPDVELAMKDCVEVRSLRREEVKGRGVPAVPEGVGTEVLEMVWSDGSRRYLGVEGVSGRLGWVSAIWDVLLACKSQHPATLPPPSPVVSLNSRSVAPTSSLASFPYPSQNRPAPELSNFQARIASLEARSGNAPPVQKVGDTWVAASVLGTSDIEHSEQRGDALRDSVQRMFDAGPDSVDIIMATPEPQGRVTPSMKERISAWQPVTERELSIFSRSNSKRSEASAIPLRHPMGYSDMERLNSFPHTETTLSFDPNDLNPSRSASQVRRAPSDGAQRLGIRYMKSLPALKEGESDDGMTEVMRRVEHVSHVTFPKPVIEGYTNMTGVASGNGIIGSLPMVGSDAGNGSGSSTGTHESAALRTPLTGQSHQSSMTTVSSTDPTVLAKLDSHTFDHGTLAKQVDGVQLDLHQIVATLATLVTASKVQSDPTRLPVAKQLDDKLTSIHLDVKSIENALNLNSLASNRTATPMEEPKLVDVHAKLDSIVRLCEDVLAKQVVGPVRPEPEIDGLPIRSSRVDGKTPLVGAGKGSLGLSVQEEDEKGAGEEVAQIMANLTGGSSSKASPKLGGIQVLHNLSAPNSPRPSTIVGKLPKDVTEQVGEVLGLVKELKEARTLQTQQTTDIARYLNELNTWLEKFVQNSTAEISSMSKRLTTLVGPEDAPQDGSARAPTMPDLVADMHSMVSEQRRKAEEEGMVGARLDALLQMMGQERERSAGQMSTVEHVISVLEKQRNDNEMLLRALATDLTSEIRGERIRFVEAMQQATSVNVQSHVEEFKKLLSTEVHKSMKELGKMREEKKALEHQISDLFALKAKHGSGSGNNSRRESAAVVPPGNGGGRGLPAPPGR